jgi:hypothetical protein
VGASGDFYEADVKESSDLDMDENQFNPKFGVMWTPLAGTTLRAAAFRTFKRTLITNQTLEPTQVAGFNQFFDDINATDAWHFGGAVYQKITENVYAGAEISKRDLNVPFYVFPPPPAPPVPQLREADWEEFLGRAYVYWAPHEWIGLRAEYLYEKFEREAEFVNGLKELKTHRFPVGISFFHPSGISIQLMATYYGQSGTFERLDAPPGVFEAGEDDFWVADAGISYRLPKRLGLITLGVTNMFDENFRYADTDVNNPAIIPERQVFGKVSLAFP